jgi:fatty-acyl-CoA synthase
MQLNLRLLLQRGQRYFGGNRIVTRLADGGRHAYTHREFGERLRRLASRLDALGTRPGERIATFAWNSYRHLELYFALPCTGRVVHTVNLRLADEHVAYILRHSQDTAVFVDPDLLPVMERIAHQVPSVRAWVVLAERLPPTTLPNAIAYEDLIAAGDPAFELPDIPENTVAGMCYTSATTGLPKGVE